MTDHPGKVGMDRNERIVRHAFGAEARFRFRQLNRIGIEGDQFSARQQGAEQFPGMSTISERRIDGYFTGFRSENFENFSQEDRAMRTRWSFAGGNYFLNRFRILPGIELFVFLFEA